MDLEVIGRHALLFDDDANALFVNSPDALVEWNSLSIDRYDVRHLLAAPPPPRKRRLPLQSADDVLESELDAQRYLDLPHSSPSLCDHLDGDNGEGPVVGGGLHAVPFSYGNADECGQPKDDDAISSFYPPFPVPESLLHNLPLTEKVHQIIARTAVFVSKHGGQSEIVLRVKQGDNPTFGFLMPDHSLHPYFRFLVDHPGLLSRKSLEDEDKKNGGGALSLLGSVYGSGEDEEGGTDRAVEGRSESSLAGSAVNTVVPDESAERSSMTSETKEVLTNAKHITSPLKEKLSCIKRNGSITTAKAGTMTGLKKENDALSADKASISVFPMLGLPVVEPPSDMKKVVDRIVEFVLRNGKEVEAVLVAQDVKRKFPFLHQSSIYHPYYLQVLQKAEESKLHGRSVTPERRDLSRNGSEKKASLPKVRESNGPDIPYDSDRKEKFKMVISKSKKDGQDQSPKDTKPEIGVKVDAAAAAAILQAATRGMKNPNRDILAKTSIYSQGPSCKSGPSLNGESNLAAPFTDSIPNASAITAAGETDASEEHLTKEQKVKAERLKRAKMFAALIKNSGGPDKSNLVRGLSAEPPDSGISRSCNEAVNLLRKEREGGSALIEVDTSVGNEKSEKKLSGENHNDHRSKRKYRSRSNKQEDSEEEVDEKEEKLEKDKENGRGSKHSRKRSRTRHSSHRSKDRHKHVKDHSSRDRESSYHHEHSSRRDEDDDTAIKSDSSSGSRCRRSHHHSSRDKSVDADRRQHSRHKHRRDSSGDEYQHSRHRHTSDEEKKRTRHHHNHHRRSRSPLCDEFRHHKKRSQREKEAELEEGEISTKSEQSKAGNGGEVVSREGSVDTLKAHSDHAPSLPSSTTMNVPDELRAKWKDSTWEDDEDLEVDMLNISDGDDDDDNNREAAGGVNSEEGREMIAGNE